MKDDLDTLPRRVPESVAARVLERAAQLDARDARTIDVEHLRAAALEAGISAVALEQALREVSEADARAAEARPRLRGGLRPAALLAVTAAVMLAVTALARLVMPPRPAWESVIIEAPRAPAPPPPVEIIVQPRR